MNANQKTYQQLTAPPSISLALMAANLATHRRRGRFGPLGIVSRENCARSPGIFPCSEEFHRIIDRISAGETP